MRAWIERRLVVESPGPLRSELRAMATFKRKGPVPKGEQRLVVRYIDGLEHRPMRDALWVPRGLVSRLPSIIRVVDRRLSMASLDFRWRPPFRLKEVQQRALAAAVRAEGGIVFAPPGSGKTAIGLAFIAQVRQPAIWIVHTEQLLTQALRAASELYDLPSGAVGVIADGKELESGPGSHLTVAMVQSLAKRPDLLVPLTRRVGVVVADEAHHCGAIRTWATVVGEFPARYRLGLTATHDREDGLAGLVESELGPVVFRVRTADTVRAGLNVVPWIRVVKTAFLYDASGASWADIQTARADDASRNALIVRLAAGEYRAGKKPIVVTELVRHSDYLAEALRRPVRPEDLEETGGGQDQSGFREQPLTLFDTN